MYLRKQQHSTYLLLHKLALGPVCCYCRVALWQACRWIS